MKSNRLVASLILGVFTAAATLSGEPPVALEKHSFAVGQVWTFHLDPTEPPATLTVIYVETLEKIGEIVFVSVSVARTATGVTHDLRLPFLKAALDESVIKIVGTKAETMYPRQYDTWKAHGAKFWTRSVNETLKMLRMRPSAPASSTEERTADAGSVTAPGGA
jgi:hypothetical protein